MAGLLLAVLVALATACSSEAGDDGGEGEPDPSGEGAADAGTDAGCRPDAWPERPGWSEDRVDYNACPDTDSFFGGDCADDSRADSPEAVALLDAFRLAVEDRGFSDRIEIVWPARRRGYCPESWRGDGTWDECLGDDPDCDAGW